MVRKALATLALVAPLAACGGGFTTNSDWDPAFDFSETSTYTWVESDSQLDDLTRNRVYAAVDAQMAANGFRKVDSVNEAALVTSYQVSSESRSSFNTMSSGWGGSSFRTGWGPSMGVSTSTTRENRWEEGTLVIAIFDADADQMVWWGSASAELDGNLSGPERTERINAAVAELMSGFPPGM